MRKLTEGSSRSNLRSLERTFVQVRVRPEIRDPDAESALGALREAIPVASVAFVRGYVLEGIAPRPDGERAAREALADPVTQTWSVDGIPGDLPADATVVSVLRRPGVMDPAEASVRRALAAIGLEVESVRTVRRYVVRGETDRVAEADLAAAARECLANEAIEEIHTGADLDVRPVHPAPYAFRRVEVPLRDASDEELARVSRERTLSLSLLEMQTIRAFFRESGREPTDAELETLAQTWSEHCKHKTLTGEVRFRGPGGERAYKNLLKETVFEATRRIAREDCLSVFADNAGVIAFDERHGVCMKVETHNHPSAIEPYGGAGTGIGGVIRDVLGTGLGARPFLNTDVFCFAPPDLASDEVPRGSLPPRRVMHGVVEGVRDYGNRMGIPTASGGLFFDPRYVGNPIVYCGTLGIIPREHVKKAARPGDRIVVIGGRTGRDGIHGATFSSAELHEESESVSAGAVQIGNPIEEKRVLDALLRARDEGLLSAVTDCGAGGLSSAVGEMGAETGAAVELGHVPLKYPGLSYSEIWISEAQERMVLAVPSEKLARVRAICAEERVEVTDLGAFADDGRLRLTYGGEPVADLPMEFLHDGLPRTPRDAVYTPPAAKPFPRGERADLGRDLRAILSSWNVCSKEWVIRQYDHEVQGGTAVKPLVGRRRDGPGDACVMTPLPGNPRGVAVSSGMNPRLGDLSPYDMAANAVDEALRNLCAVGANPRRAAILDNFSWGNCAKPDRLGALVLAAEALRDTAIAYGTPFVSGKDSLNNEYAVEGRTIVIPHTLLVSAFCVVDDARRCVTMDLKEPGNLLFAVGVTRDELGGSHLALARGVEGGAVPRVRCDEGLAAFDGVHRAIAAGLVRSCHDLSEGGLAAALAEMAFAGGLGVEAALAHVPFEETGEGGVRDEVLLFSESPSRFVCEVRPENAEAFARGLRGVPSARIGRVTQTPRLAVRGLRDERALDEDIEALREAFTAPLRGGAR